MVVVIFNSEYSLHNRHNFFQEDDFNTSFMVNSCVSLGECLLVAAFGKKEGRGV